MPYVDFDRARKAREPVRFTMRGKDYELPGDPPAGAVLAMMAGAGPDGAVTFGTAMKLLVDLIGQDNVDSMTADGMTFPDLLALLDWISDVYELSGPGGDQGNGTGAPLLSSSTGPSSKPTSNASIAAIHSA